jgi:hypothetical protein
MKKLIHIYPYIAPIILTPLSFMLWHTTYDSNLPLILIAWLIPILWAYIVPGVGTNICKVWEFDTKLKLGKFRPHHGFVFGSFTSFLTWLCHGELVVSIGSILSLSLVMASVLGFWNFLYDIQAIKIGMIKVYNDAYANNKDPEVIAFNYAPWLFGGFGAIYGLTIGIAEYLSVSTPLTWMNFSMLFSIGLLLSIAIPIFSFMLHSKHKYGHYGTKPIMQMTEPPC